MNKPKIEIWDNVGFGLIVGYPTGIIISNQTGGTSCFHPEIEGFFLPMLNDYSIEKREFISPEIEISEYFYKKYEGSGATQGIDNEDIIFLENLLTEYGLNFIKVDKDKQTESHEAWIYTRIINNQKNELMVDFKESEFRGVITWANSD